MKKQGSRVQVKKNMITERYGQKTILNYLMLLILLTQGPSKPWNLDP